MAAAAWDGPCRDPSVALGTKEHTLVDKWRQDAASRAWFDERLYSSAHAWDVYDSSKLFCAVWDGDAAKARALLRAGVNPNHKVVCAPVQAALGLAEPVPVLFAAAWLHHTAVVDALRRSAAAPVGCGPWHIGSAVLAGASEKTVQSAADADGLARTVQELFDLLRVEPAFELLFVGGECRVLELLLRGEPVCAHRAEGPGWWFRVWEALLPSLLPLPDLALEPWLSLCAVLHAHRQLPRFCALLQQHGSPPGTKSTCFAAMYTSTVALQDVDYLLDCYHALRALGLALNERLGGGDWWPLHLAVRHDSPLVPYLLADKADRFLKNARGQTPLAVAEQARSKRARQHLLRR